MVVSTGTGRDGLGAIHPSLVASTEVALARVPEERRLAFFVREAFPSVATGTSITDGEVREGEALAVTSRMNGDGVIFGDGIEADRLPFGWGTCASAFGWPKERLHLVRV